MEIEEAIKTAIGFETRIVEIYKEAYEKISTDSGRRLVEALFEDEKNHLEYLQHKLEQFMRDGIITLDRLESVIPPKEVIVREVAKLKQKISEGSRSDIKQIISRALSLEIETSEFYRRMVGELSEEGKELFAHFLEIEEAHITLVQAEFDYFNNTGYWFDIKEFDME